MPQYIHDNTDDEISHFEFINAYLISKGADPVNLDQFRTLPSSQGDGGPADSGRLTNLMQLTVDTSYLDSVPQPHRRTRTSIHTFTFPQAVPGLCIEGQFPRTDEDLRRSPPRLPPLGRPGSSQSDRLHGRIPLWHDRARRNQPLPVAGSEGNPSGRLANRPEHRSHGGNALSDLA